MCTSDADYDPIEGTMVRKLSNEPAHNLQIVDQIPVTAMAEILPEQVI